MCPESVTYEVKLGPGVSMSSLRHGESEPSPPELALVVGSSLPGLSGSCHALKGTSEAKVCMAPLAGDRFTFLFALSAEDWSTLTI